MAFSHVHTSNPTMYQYSSAKFNGTSPRGPFGDAAEEMDWVAGQIVDTINDLGLSNNTIVYFTSDNGPWLIRNQSGGSVGLFTGRTAGYWDVGKGSTWEGGVREPAAVWWPGQIKPHTVSTELVTTMDIFTTSLLLAGVAVPSDRVIDGVDMRPVLFGGKSLVNAVFLYRNADFYAVRYGSWKAHFQTQSGYNGYYQYHDPPLLFNVDVDPSEAYPVNTTTQPQLMQEIYAAVAAHNATVVRVKDQLLERNPVYALCCDIERGCFCSNWTKPDDNDLLLSSKFEFGLQL